MKTFVISLGGSLIVPDEVDYNYLKKFKKVIDKYLAKGFKFIIVTGGGRTARKYQEIARKNKKISDEEADWLGIEATHENAYIVCSLFQDSKFVKADSKKVSSKVVVAGGWKPGWSTDYVAAYLAKKYGSRTIINLSNIDYAYNKDPKKYKGAKKLKNVSWKDFRAIVGNEWKPGMNAPFDPVASKLCEKNKFKVVIANGKKLKNLERILENKPFKGTIVQ